MSKPPIHTVPSWQWMRKQTSGIPPCQQSARHEGRRPSGQQKDRDVGVFQVLADGGLLGTCR